MPSDILKELDDYYKENGILSTSFICEYKKDCTSFTGPKSTFVSSGYEKNERKKGWGKYSDLIYEFIENAGYNK